MNGFRTICSVAPLRNNIRKFFRSGAQKSFPAFGLLFPNRVGLGAGFDKNAKYLLELETIGFGFVEIGTVTPRPQQGNEKPRVFRLPKDKALINRMGFNNDGVEVIAGRLKRWRKGNDHWQNTGKRKNVTAISPSSINRQPSSMLIGGNIGKNKLTPNEEAWKDYEICFRELHPYVDFFVVNVSSPNTPGLRELQEKEALKKILTHLQNLNTFFSIQRPILLKIAPDLTLEQIDDVIDLAQEINLDGLVATNTTISREALQTSASEVEAIGAGGLSGKPVKEKSTGIVRYIHQKTNGSIPIIGSGGIFTAEEAKEKITAGASLVEVWTGFVYEGPTIVKKIVEKLS